jgi:hypothetical protein
MVTKVRPPNKTLWALDEAIADHDPSIAELVEQLLNHLEREEEAARNRYDKTAQLRLAKAVATLARLQLHCSRLAALHRQARNNEYDGKT